MNHFKKMYYEWVEKTENLENPKTSEHYIKLRNFYQENEQNKLTYMGFLVSEISDEEFRCKHALILLHMMNGRNVVPLSFRDDLDASSFFWVDYYEDIILKERFF